MAKLTKKAKSFEGKFDREKVHSIDEAIAVLKDCASKKFVESVEVAIKLGVDAKKSDQNVRGATSLPNGTGKNVKVAVFAQGPKAEEAEKAGADVVGMEDLAEEFKGGNFNYNVVIASPDAMKVVGKLGQILGPRGLMPNPKDGTVNPDVAQAVKNAKSGQARLRCDKAGIVHTLVGKVDFEVNALKENLEAVLAELIKLKPSGAKGVYLRKLSVSSTMGPGLQVDLASLKY